MPIFLSQTKSDKDNEFLQEPVLTIHEFFEGWFNFNCYFGVSSKQNLGKKLLIDWRVMKSFVTAQCASKNIPLANAVVGFYHGLNHSNSLETGLCVFGTPEPIVRGVQQLVSIPQLPDNILRASATNMTYLGLPSPLHQIQPVSSWDEGINYETIHVHRSPEYPHSLSFQNFQPLEDPKIVMFPWQAELLKLASDNGVDESGNYFLIVSDYANYVDTSVPSRVIVGGSSGYYHSKSLHVGVLRNNEILDLLAHQNAVSVPNFRSSAIDYGNMCPPLCDRVRF
jgi:hypothetical protein